MDLQLGYIVVPANASEGLHSGAGVYGAAVVACLDPFLVVSRQTDMCWSTRKPESFKPMGKVEPDVLNASQRRVPADKQVRAPCGESFLSNQLSCGLTLYQLGVKPLAIDLNRKSKVWPCMGQWSKSIAEEDNPTYGWVFAYEAHENLWRALHEMPKLPLEVFESAASYGLVQIRREGTLTEFQTVR